MKKVCSYCGEKKQLKLYIIEKIGKPITPTAEMCEKCWEKNKI